jgi:hypothetical protein
MYALKISRYDIPTVKSIVNADIISAVMASWSIRSVLRTVKTVKATNVRSGSGSGLYSVKPGIVYKNRLNIQFSGLVLNEYLMIQRYLNKYLNI